MEVKESILTAAEYRQYFETGITYEEYRSESSQTLEAYADDPKMKEYIAMNEHRMNRLDKHYSPSIEILNVLKNLSQTLNWLVISEHWCGDAAQNVPALYAIAAASEGKIKMRIVYRDKNLDLIDAHLTGASRSIPKLIQLDKDYHYISEWGPRPRVAQELVLTLRANPETRDIYANELHKWYGFNKSKALEGEITNLLAGL